MNEYKLVGKLNDNVSLYWKESDYKKKDGTQGHLNQLVMRVLTNDAVNPNNKIVQEINLSHEKNYKVLYVLHNNGTF